MAVELKNDVVKIEKQIDVLMDRIVESDSPTIMAAYEIKIGKLEKQKLIAAEKLQNSGKPVHSFDEMFQHALEFLSNP